MSSSSNEIKTIDQLREFVYLTLCEYGHFEPGAFPMSEHILLRSGDPCGMHFCLQGPREVRVSAIWETDGNGVFFYGSDGRRFRKIQLVDAPISELVAA